MGQYDVRTYCVGNMTVNEDASNKAVKRCCDVTVCDRMSGHC
jgi:hypothetical protein